MTDFAVLPFQLRHDSEQVNVEAGAGTLYLSTAERVQGIARLERDAVVLQFVSTLETTRVTDAGVRVEQATSPTRDVVLPLAALAGAEHRKGLWRDEVRLLARDLRPFADLPCRRPGELRLRVARGDRVTAADFASAVQLALADHRLREVESGGGIERLSP